jgi:phosphatidylglycerol:prolipoprotein diacylglycerol transferase
MFPKLIDADGFYLPTYGVLVALAFLVGIWITTRLARRIGLDPERVTNLAVYCAIAGMLGAKLLMFVFDWDYFARNPGEIFSLRTLQAAGVYQGGFLLALAVAFLYMWRNAMPALGTADCFAPGLAAGHAIGRLGCFAAGCCWGSSCDRSWAVTFRNPDAHELTGVPLNVPLHPAQLYESVANVAIFAGLYLLFRRPHREGTILGWYLVAYSCVRFVIEFFRHHEQALPFGMDFSLTQWIAMGTFVAGVLLLVWRRSGRVIVPDAAPATSVS